MSALPTIVSFWHGPLSWLERLCVRSFAEHGHRFELYAYEPLDMPGAVARDANDIIPREKMFFYKRDRTPAVFADLFRLELMRREAGIWADCDVFCIKPFAGLPGYVFGIEAGTRVNNAVFRCPADSELLQSLLKTFEPGAIPPGMPWWRAAEVRLRRLFGDALPVQDMQFGATGPWPLNFHVQRLGLQHYVQPKSVFYPLDYGAARQLMAPGFDLADAIRPETLGVHLWHSALTDRGSGTLPLPAPGSWFAKQLERLG